MDIPHFQKNRQQFPPEKLARYAGQYVAWSPDDTHILASDEDELQLAIPVRLAGHNSAEVLILFEEMDVDFNDVSDRQEAGAVS